MSQSSYITLSEICEAVISETQILYAGRVIEMINSHSYRVGKNYYNSLAEAKEAALKSPSYLQNSINRIK